MWNRVEEKAEPLLCAGARLARCPAEAAESDVVMTILADDAALECVVFGGDGIAGAAALHVSMSTTSLALSGWLAAQPGAGGYVAAPVFGRPAAAAEARLFVVAAGASAHLDRCAPLFSAIGQRTFRIGDRPPSANLVKLSGNFMITAAIEAMAEAMTLAKPKGVESTGRHCSRC